MVRGGRDGEREDAALTEGLAIAGWDELGDLTNCDTRDDLLYVKSYGARIQRRVRRPSPNWTGHSGDFCVRSRMMISY
jgi:restriction system protein